VKFLTIDDCSFSLARNLRVSGVARGVRRVLEPPIMPEKIFDHKKICQHAIVLRLYTYDILFTTSRLSRSAISMRKL
jgi:hypothetical protein